jgi:hypothetical protein
MTKQHKPTPEQRKTVAALTAYGIKQDKVAAVVGISDVTLRLHYAHELDTAEAEANGQVAQSLFNMATKGKNVAAAIFWLKTRAGYRETIRVGGEPGGAPVMLQIISGVDRGEPEE